MIAVSAATSCRRAIAQLPTGSSRWREQHSRSDLVVHGEEASDRRAARWRPEYPPALRSCDVRVRQGAEARHNASQAAAQERWTRRDAMREDSYCRGHFGRERTTAPARLSCGYPEW